MSAPGDAAMRTVLFTGKGGVGKTTIAAATAVHCARHGLRTAVMSTDPAHSLADAFDMELGDDHTEVAPGLVATQLDAGARMERSWGEIRSYLRELFDWAGLDDVEAEELSLLPGLEEVFALADIRRIDRTREVDVLIVDCAPTAETVRLLSLPDVLGWYVERIMPTGRRVNRLVGPAVSRLTKLPLAGDGVFDAVDGVHRDLDDVRTILRDASRSTIRLVCTPEKMVVAEARRMFTYLSLFGYSVDAVVANRLLPADIEDPWFDRWKTVQRHQVDEIHNSFRPLPVITSDLSDEEIVGVERLAVLGEAMYHESSGADVMFRGTSMCLDESDDAVALVVPLPFVDKGDVDVTLGVGEVFVTVGSYRRPIALPDSLRHRDVLGARLVDGALRIEFGEP